MRWKMYFKEKNEFLEMLQAVSLHHIQVSPETRQLPGGGLCAVTGIWNKDVQTTAQLHTPCFMSRVRSRLSKAQSKSHWQLLQCSS